MTSSVSEKTDSTSPGLRGNDFSTEEKRLHHPLQRVKGTDSFREGKTYRWSGLRRNHSADFDREPRLLLRRAGRRVRLGLALGNSGGSVGGSHGTSQLLFSKQAREPSRTRIAV